MTNDPRPPKPTNPFPPPAPPQPNTPNPTASKTARRPLKAKAVSEDGSGHDGRVRCGAPARAGHPCGQAPGWGTDHPGVGKCKLHGGSTANHRKAAAREIAEAQVVAAVAQLPRLGLIVETTGVDALADALNRSYGLVQASALRVAALEPNQWAQRDLSGKFLRPSVYLEIYWRHLETYARIAKDCVGLGIAAAAVDVVRRDAEQVQTLLQGFVQALGMAWDDEPVRLALVTAIDRFEGAA